MTTLVDWSETYDKIKNSIDGAVEALGEKFSEIGKAIEDWIDEKIEWFNDTWIGKQIKSIVDTLSTENKMTETVEELGGHYRGSVGDAEELRARREQMSETESSQSTNNNFSDTTITSDALSAALRVVDRELVSGGGDKGSTIIAPNNSSNNVINNNTINSGSSADDMDRTFRRSQMSGGFMAW